MDTLKTIQPTNKTEAKHWCFTINNYTDAEVLPRQGEYEYMIVGKEVSKTGTPHLQGYVCFPKKRRFFQVVKMLPRAHLEVARGTPQQASEYCKKEGDYKEYGVIPVWKRNTAVATKKRKADYDAAVDLAKKQKLYEIPSGLLSRHMSAYKQIARDHPPSLDDNEYLCGIWMYGPPGVGKSRSARWLFPGAYPKPLNKWWDGYKHEDYVILDDIEPVHAVLGHHIKQWADHYPYTAEQKGSSIRIRPKIICVTSNYTIDEIWSDVMATAIKRRFLVVNCEPKLLKTAKKPLYCPPKWAEDSQEEMVVESSLDTYYNAEQEHFAPPPPGDLMDSDYSE